MWKETEKEQIKRGFGLILKAMGSLSRFFRRELMPELCFKKNHSGSCVNSRFDGEIRVDQGIN